MSGTQDWDQDAVIAFLEDPRTHGGPVERIDTHAASVFLSAGRAFKLKRAVHLPYLDFTSLASRRAMCLRELELNRRTAPEIYRAVRAIVPDGEGGLRFATSADEEGRALDWVIEMRRFEPSSLFETLAREGRLNAAHVRDLADAIARFHDEMAAPVADDGISRVRRVIAGNRSSMEEAGSGILPAQEVEELAQKSTAYVTQLEALLRERAAHDQVRLCHGDLHLGNICLWNGKATPFDCLEFDDELATSDVLYDLAFPVMDLWHCGYRQGASLLLNRYFDMQGLAGRAMRLMPLFISMRAAVRSHVNAAVARQQTDTAGRTRHETDARSYLAHAIACLEPARPSLVAVGGYSGTGKSTLAGALAPHIASSAATRWLRSDVIRKRLAGVVPETRLPADSYTQQASQQVYAALEDGARDNLQNGVPVVVDAVFSKPEERIRIESIAQELGVKFQGLWLDAPGKILRDRVAQRIGDASDATPDIVDRQRAGNDATPDGWHVIDAGQSRDEVRKAALACLGVNEAIDHAI